MMTLSNILDMVSRRLTDAGVDCLLIGGFAVNYHGYDFIRSQVEALKNP